MLHKHSQRFLFLYKLCDASIILFSFLITYSYIFTSLSIDLHYLVLATAVLITWYANAAIFKIYERQRSNTLFFELKLLFKSAAIMLCVISPVLFYLKPYFSRRFVFFYFLISLVLQIVLRLLVRMLLRYLRRKGYNTRKLLIIGCSHEIRQVLDKVNNHPEFGYKDPIVVADDATDPALLAVCKGSTADLESIITAEDVDDVIITYPQHRESEVFDLFTRCETVGVRVRIVPDFFRLMHNRIVMQEIGELPLLGMRPEPLISLWNRTIKRLFDVLFSLGVLIVFSPLFLLIIVLVKLTSPGPIFFKQERIGINNRRFHIYKFRSMRVQDEKQSDTVWTSRNDPRITPLGKLLRTSNLDEFPQFYNVLIGQMSVVGPRPERERFVNQFSKEIYAYRVRHLVRVGITGWAQVNGFRGDTSIADRIKYDLYYLENWSLWFDIKIVFKTIFSTKNAM